MYLTTPGLVPELFNVCIIEEFKPTDWLEKPVIVPPNGEEWILATQA